MRRRRPILEDMAEMAAAAAAMHFGADHAIGAVGRGFDRACFRIVETRPAGAAVEFFLRGEQFLLAAGAIKRAGALFVIERARARPLGAVLAHDMELLRRENFVPLGVGMGDGVVLGVGGDAHGWRPFGGGLPVNVILGWR